ncbi:MAG: type IX secretion system protein PorQ [Balneola sp.]
MKSKETKSLLLLSIFCLWTTSVFSQSDGSTIFRFLDVTPNASASALGGNHTGLYNGDFSSMNINPAYLFGAESNQVSATFVNLLADSKMGFTNGTRQINKNNYAGLGIRFIGYGDFKTIDENGEELGSFSAIDLAVTGAYATKLANNWSGGVALDLIHSSYERYKSSAFSVSGGIYYKNIASHFSFGAAVRNLGTQLSTYAGTREPMPLDVSVGISKKPEGFPAEIALTFRRLNDWDMRTLDETATPSFFDNAFRHVILGGTFDFSESFHIRLGYNRYLHELNKTKENFDFAGVGMGIGFNVKKLIIDISRNSYSETGGVVQLSIKTAL